MCRAGRTVEQIGQRCVEIDPNQDRNGEERDDERLIDDLLALEAEEKHQHQEERDQRGGLQLAEPALQFRIAAGPQHPHAHDLGDDHRHDDVKTH
jgi:hypothetical protein